MKDKSLELFANAPIPKAVLSNVIPSIVSMLMVLIYNLADTVFIGQTKNAHMMAAVSVATPAFLLFMAIGMLFGIGGTSLISRMLGAGKQEKARKVSSFCFWCGITIGIVSTVGILLFLEPVCLLIGASPDTLEYTKQYLSIVSLGIPFLIMSNIFSNVIRAEGNAQKAMFGMILGNLLNIVLDPIMILAMDLDVKGAALATVIGNLAASLFYLLHLLGKHSMLSIHIRDFAIGDGILTGVFAIGIPASLNSVLMSTSNIFINNLMKPHGDMAVAGLGVAMKVNMIVVMLLIGLGTGIQPLLGYCFGARNRKRFFGVLKFSIVLALGLSLVMTAICYFGAATLVRLILDNDDAFQYGFQFSRIYILSGPILGLMFVFVNAIQSMGAALPSLILSISRQGLLYLPILFLMNHVFHSATTLALAQPITDYVGVVLCLILLIVSYRKYFARDNEAPAAAAR